MQAINSDAPTEDHVHGVKIMVHVQLSQLDWLKVSVLFTNKKLFQDAIEAAYQTYFFSEIDFLNRRWIVTPTKLKKKGALDLHHESGLSLTVDRSENLGGDYPLKIDLHKPRHNDLPCLLWENPIETMNSFLKEVEETFGEVTYILSRIDLCCHFTGWVPVAEDINRFNKGYPIGPYRSPQGQFSGFMLGNPRPKTPRVVGTLYDVPLRMKDKPTSFNPTNYYQDYQASEPVWNLEFKVHRAVLKSFGIESLTDIEPNRAGLWNYLTCKKFKLLIPSGDKKEYRWEVDPSWKQLEKAHGEPLMPLKRIRTESNPQSIALKTKIMEGWIIKVLAAHGVRGMTFDEKFEVLRDIVNKNRFTDEAIDRKLAQSKAA